MDENKRDKEAEKVEIRHTINAEETFTLAKDVFDLRCLIKNVYSNRAVIARRLNILSLSVSFIYTLLYVGYIFLTGLTKKLNLGGEISLFCLLGVYAAMFAVLLILTLCGAGAKAKNIRKLNKAMSVFRLIVRLLSLSLTIVALVFATAGGYSAKHIAFDIAVIIISVICLIFQVIPLLAGGVGKLARWLLSPVKIKRRFSQVALEWYELAVTDGGENKTVKRVSKKYYDEIGACLDNFLIPELGKKYVSQIKPAAILNVAEGASAEERPLVEGILKSVFGYATECGYVTFNPCRDLSFEGSIEEEIKQKKTLKERIMGVGKKVGMSILDKYINKNVDGD